MRVTVSWDLSAEACLQQRHGLIIALLLSIERPQRYRGFERCPVPGAGFPAIRVRPLRISSNPVRRPKRVVQTEVAGLGHRGLGEQGDIVSPVEHAHADAEDAKRRHDAGDGHVILRNMPAAARALATEPRMPSPPPGKILPRADRGSAPPARRSSSTGHSVPARGSSNSHRIPKEACRGSASREIQKPQRKRLIANAPPAKRFYRAGWRWGKRRERLTGESAGKVCRCIVPPRPGRTESPAAQ